MFLDSFSHILNILILRLISSKFYSTCGFWLFLMVFECLLLSTPFCFPLDVAQTVEIECHQINCVWNSLTSLNPL